MVCANFSCRVDYPHTHNGQSIDDPPVRLYWPKSLLWRRPTSGAGRESRGSPYYLFKFGWFASHSGFQLPWKIDCEDGLRDEDWNALASIVAGKFGFSDVYGIPRGGTKFARALAPFCEPGYPTLIVDDVLTTGRSFEDARQRFSANCIGVVVFARGRCPDWVWPIFTVNEWAQSRATGLG
jgi:hypothetical protein